MASILSHALLKMPSRIVCMNQASEFFIGPIGFTYWKSSSSSDLQSLIWSTLLIHLMLSYIYTFTYKKGDVSRAWFKSGIQYAECLFQLAWGQVFYITEV